MKCVIQRVQFASCIADGNQAGSCKNGLFLLLGVAVGDEEEDAVVLAEKISKLRIFCDENDKMNKSILDIGGEILCVSNFTLNANYVHGNRPDYFGSAKPDEANRIYEFFVSELKKRVSVVTTGVFGADMKISTTLDGPVTICMDSEVLRKKNS